MINDVPWKQFSFVWLHEEKVGKNEIGNRVERMNARNERGCEQVEWKMWHVFIIEGDCFPHLEGTSQLVHGTM